MLSYMLVCLSLSPTCSTLRPSRRASGVTAVLNCHGQQRKGRSGLRWDCLLTEAFCNLQPALSADPPPIWHSDWSTTAEQCQIPSFLLAIVWWSSLFLSLSLIFHRCYKERHLFIALALANSSIWSDSSSSVALFFTTKPRSFTSVVTHLLLLLGKNLSNHFSNLTLSITNNYDSM